MGQSRGNGDQGTREPAAAHGLDPASPLTVAEAAALAGVPLATLEAQLDDGSLLFETGQGGRAGNRIVRLMDLADLYPKLRPGAAGPPAEPDPEEPSESTVPARVDSRVNSLGADDSIAGAVRASGADRNALIELCQDLETRLDLAERERQASTASLLMAQRRVLDLERRDERRPIAWMAAATLGVFGVALAILAFRLPSTVRAAAREELGVLQSDFEERTARMRESLDASMASLAGSMSAAMETAREEERELLKSEREAQAAQIAALEARLAEARALQLSETEALTRELTRQVTDEAAERLAADVEERRVRNEALELRLRAAEALGDSAREALAQERSVSEAEREAFRQQLEETLERHDEALKAALARLEASGERPAPAAEPSEKESTPAPWWKRALGDLRD
ncbi:hypothetical protein Poly30_26830 [Planctomycetes bacterium Poly30]|uniref:Uncharacterized protein n=1 Tax=Saltatorellus ferox TaxID=2528018 RepID=A0A518ESU5_9BACT|nr:hypothetical protein Poly30_26830 [Planctomycetes bacterium Poly30]